MAEEGVCRCARELSDLLTQAAWGIEDVARGRWETLSWRLSTRVEPGLGRLEECLGKRLEDLRWILGQGKRYAEERSESSALLFLGALISEAPHKACGK
jgi:hypothetical protein